MKKVGDFENIAVILKFKKAEKEEQLELKAKEALTQIKTKDYIAKAKKRGAKKIYGYGIGFYKTEVLIEMAVF